jgi:hypothetical protein
MYSKKRRYLVAVTLVLMLVFSTGSVASATSYPQQDGNGKMWFDTDISDEGGYGYAFNIQGYFAESLYMTTFDNWGYEVFLKEQDDEEAT